MSANDGVLLVSVSDEVWKSDDDVVGGDEVGVGVGVGVGVVSPKANRTTVNNNEERGKFCF